MIDNVMSKFQKSVAEVMILSILALLFTAFLAECPNENRDTSTDTTPPVTLANPPSGTYAHPLFVTLTPNEPADTYYSTSPSTLPQDFEPCYKLTNQLDLFGSFYLFFCFLINTERSDL